MKIDITVEQFEDTISKGYTMDMVFLLMMIHEQYDVKLISEDNPKLQILCQSIHRKGLITSDYKITETGTKLLEYLKAKTRQKFVKPKISAQEFDDWWEAYPGTDSFEHAGRKFQGSRSLRSGKEDCRVKFNVILSEKEYTAQELIDAMKHDVLLKKEASVKENKNKLSFMQNSLTYLNQRSYEPFIELIRAGVVVKQSTKPVGGTDI
jgi:hypothetical protein